MTLVSVCIPAYNAERWLGEAIESITAQTWPHVETIIVDDGSTDGTLAAARRYANAHVTVLSQPNRGPGAARNRALREAQGDYIQFLDADDVLSPDKLGAAVELLEASGDPNAVAISRWGRFSESITTAEHHWEPSYRDQSGLEFLIHSRTKQPGGTQPIGSWLFPRGLVDRVGPWSEAHPASPADDGDYLASVLALGGITLRFEPQGFLYYRAVPHSQSSQDSEAHLRAFFGSVQHAERCMRRIEDSPRTHYAAACAYKCFYMDFYTIAPRDLIETAIEREQFFGGAPDFEPTLHWSPTLRALRAVVGWRAMLRLRSAYRRVRYR